MLERKTRILADKVIRWFSNEKVRVEWFMYVDHKVNKVIDLRGYCIWKILNQRTTLLV